MPWVLLNTIMGKSVISGLLAGGSIEAVTQVVTDDGHTQLVLGVFSLLGVLGVAAITAITNLRLSRKHGDVDMKEVRRLRREVKEKDQIIEALTDREHRGA